MAGMPMPAGIVAMSPWADLSLSGWSVLDNARNDSTLALGFAVRLRAALSEAMNPSDPYASPAFASFKDFPPIMVHAGSREILRDDASAGRPRGGSRRPGQRGNL